MIMLAAILVSFILNISGNISPFFSLYKSRKMADISSSDYYIVPSIR